MPFLAVPSEKVLAEFQPVRGLLVTAPLPGGADNRPAVDFQSLADLTDLHDPRPLIAAICQEMGYDPNLVAEGEGETGVPGHSWMTYCDETWLPMLVRWQAGDAQLILTFAETHGRDFYPDLTLSILGDAAALPILWRLAVALTPFHFAQPCRCEALVQVAGRRRLLGIPEIPLKGFDIGVHVQGNAAGLIGPARAEELAEVIRLGNVERENLRDRIDVLRDRNRSLQNTLNALAGRRIAEREAAAGGAAEAAAQPASDLNTHPAKKRRGSPAKHEQVQVQVRS
jgi:hypothetical protein